MLPGQQFPRTPARLNSVATDNMKRSKNQVSRRIPVIPALRRQRQAYILELEASVVHISKIRARQVLSQKTTKGSRPDLGLVADTCYSITGEADSGLSLRPVWVT